VPATLPLYTVLPFAAMFAHLHVITLVALIAVVVAGLGLPGAVSDDDAEMDTNYPIVALKAKDGSWKALLRADVQLEQPQ
jgi:hypothetical protein